MYDPDEFDDRAKESVELDKLLARFQDCNLNDYDSDFVGDLTDRLAKYGSSLVLTPRQQQHLETMKERYHV